MNKLWILANALGSAFKNNNFDDWTKREKAVAALIESAGFDAWSLGGDILRPTLLAGKDGMEYLAFIEHPKLGASDIVKKNIGGSFPQSSFTCNNSEVVVVCGNFPQLFARLYNKTTVTLTNLININRYPTIRMPLNIARLAQWLRFWHYGSCTAFDAPIDFYSDIDAQAKAIVETKSDILGISVGFGETDRLLKLLEVIRKTSYRPLLILGNIGASLAEEALRQCIVGFDNVEFCKGYGENYFLDILCKKYSGNKIENLSTNPPNILVMPDERLIVETIKQNGQLSFESSFGCHYSMCSFCPRLQRGSTWKSAAFDESEVLIQEILTKVRHNNEMNSCKILSLTDEDFFGKIDENNYYQRSRLLINLSSIAKNNSFQLEIYARIEQLFSKMFSVERNEFRIRCLQTAQPQLKRVFLGVESGSESQLIRYAKGQTVQDIVLALRVGSLIQLPLEFGFITFDPLMTVDELIENLLFLARTDVMLKPFDSQPEPRTIIHQALFPMNNDSQPLFFHVAYMATELEVLYNSKYFNIIKNDFKHLIFEFDQSFFRLNVKYESPVIEKVLGICRVWTEGTFTQIYDHRLKSRTIINNHDNMPNSLLGRYRLATYMIMLLSLTSELDSICKELTEIISSIQQNYNWPYSKFRNDKLPIFFTKVWQWIDHMGEYAHNPPNFNEIFRWKRRQS